MLKSYDKIFNIVSLIGVAMIWVPLSLILLDGTFPESSMFFPAFVILASVIGYAFQGIFAGITGKRRSRDGYDADSMNMVISFRLKYAVVPILLIAIISVLVYYVFDIYMRNLYHVGLIEYYHEIYSYVAAALFFIPAVSGCVVWFYPIERLASIYTLIAGGAIFYLETAFAAITANDMRSGAVGVQLALSFAVFNICVLIIFNQSTLQKKFRGSVVSVITPAARLYNLYLVLILILCLAATCVVMYVLLSGVCIILRMILYLILYKIFYGKDEIGRGYNNYTYINPDEASAKFQRDTLGAGNQYLLAMFFTLLLISAFLFIAAKSGFLKKTIAAIKSWLRDILDTFNIGIDIFKHSFDPDAIEDEICNYKDEKKRLHKAEVRDYDELANRTESYKSFLQRLGRLKSFDEQLCYAYSVLLKQYRKMNISLKQSDTPREVEAKVSRVVLTDEIEQITADFEKIHYAEEEVSVTESTQMLNNICALIKRYMF